MPVIFAGSPVSTPKGTTSSISKSTASPIRTECLRPSSFTSIGKRSTPRFSPTSGPRASIGPPSAPENTAPSFSACSSEAAASMTTPRRQLPSLITFGESATAATVRPLTSVPSTSPFLTWNTSTTLQRFFVAPSESDAVQGQTTSHEQVSKYEPARFQGMSPPSDGDGITRDCIQTGPGGSTVAARQRDLLTPVSNTEEQRVALALF